MTENPNLIETSFADAIVIITAAQELPEQSRRHWTTSLRRIAKALDKPLEMIPAATAPFGQTSPSYTRCRPE